MAPVATPVETGDAASEAGDQEAPGAGGAEAPAEVAAAPVTEEMAPVSTPVETGDAASEAGDQEAPGGGDAVAPAEVADAPATVETLPVPTPSDSTSASPETSGPEPSVGGEAEVPELVVAAPTPADSPTRVPTEKPAVALPQADVRDSSVSGGSETPEAVADAPIAPAEVPSPVPPEPEDTVPEADGQEAFVIEDSEAPAVIADAPTQGAAPPSPEPSTPEAVEPAADGRELPDIEDAEAPTAVAAVLPLEETPSTPRAPARESAERPAAGSVADSVGSPSQATQEETVDDPGAIQTRAPEDAGTEVERSGPAPSVGAAVAALPPTPENVPSAASSEPKPADVVQYDVVQVSPDGRIVVAGRTEPGAMVDLLNDGVVVATERADSRGEFVFIPDLQLMPGVRELSLAVRTDDGAEVRATTKTVVVVIPDREVVAGVVAETDEAGVGTTAVALLVDEGGETVRILDSGEVLADPDTVLSLTTVTFDEAGYASITGGGGKRAAGESLPGQRPCRYRDHQRGRILDNPDAAPAVYYRFLQAASGPDRARWRRGFRTDCYHADSRCGEIAACVGHSGDSREGDDPMGDFPTSLWTGHPLYVDLRFQQLSDC